MGVLFTPALGFGLRFESRAPLLGWRGSRVSLPVFFPFWGVFTGLVRLGERWIRGSRAPGVTLGAGRRHLIGGSTGLRMLPNSYSNLKIPWKSFFWRYLAPTSISVQTHC